MADQEIKIRIEAEGDENLDKLWKKFEKGSATLNEMTRLKKEFNKLIRDTPPGTEFDVLATKLAKVNDAQRDVRIQTKAGHEAYFKAGLELRQLALAGLGANTALGKLSNTIGSSFTNAVQLKQALVPLGITMGPLALGIAGVASALLMMKDNLAALIEESRKIDAKWLDILMGSPGTTPEQATNMIDQRTASIEAMKRAALSAIADVQNKGRVLGVDLLAKFGVGPGTQKEQIVALENKIALWDQELYGLAQKKLSLEEKITAEKQKQADAAQKEAFSRFRIGGPSVAPGLPYSMSGGIDFSRPSGPAPIPKGLEGEPGEVWLKTLDKAEKQTISLTQQMANGFANSTNVLAQGFVRAFGLGQSLLDQFIASFLGSLAQTGLNFLTGGLFGLLGLQHGGMIPEPVVGMGRSGRVYAFGEAGPEYVTPTSSNAIAFGSMQRQMGAMTDAITAREWQLKGTNLVLAYDRANKVLRERRM